MTPEEAIPLLRRLFRNVETFGDTVRITTEGGPDDPFIRIVETLEVDEHGQAYIAREIIPRGYAKQIEVSVDFGKGDGKP